VELGAARVCEERQPEVEFIVMAPMAYGNGSVLTHVEKGGLLWPVQGG
jgi:hypothetical protein